jgi:hypothetical protein
MKIKQTIKKQDKIQIYYIILLYIQIIYKLYNG